MAPEILYFAIPGFVVLLLLEAWYAWKEHKDLYEVKDTFSSLAMGIGNVISGLLAKIVVFGAFAGVYQFRLFTLPFTGWMWVLAFSPTIFRITGSIMYRTICAGSGLHM